MTTVETKRWDGAYIGVELKSTEAQLKDFQGGKVHKDFVEYWLHGIEMCRRKLEDSVGSPEDDAYLKGQIAQLKENVNILDRMMAFRVQQDQIDGEEAENAAQ